LRKKEGGDGERGGVFLILMEKNISLSPSLSIIERKIKRVSSILFVKRHFLFSLDVWNGGPQPRNSQNN
jgi:hypothetical protein